uniref:Uncharacterized protein n=2 Tax=Haplochromini TaxID=319058 RepID=A0A3Q2WFD1_HAPBU
FGVCKSKWVLKTNIQKQSNHPDLHSSLLVCHDASSPPSQLVLLQNSCEAIVEGKEILDLPKLPSGGGRDCCFQEGTTLALLHSTPPTLTALTLKWQTLILTLLIVVDLLSNNLLVGDCGYGYI